MKKMIMLLMVLGVALWANNATDLNKATDTHGTILIKSNDGAARIGHPVQMQGRDILISQLPDSLADYGYACQLDSVYPFFSDMVDDITLPAGSWSIFHIATYWDNWNGFTSWANVPNLHVKVYNDSAGASPPMPVDSCFIDVTVNASDYTVTDYGDVAHYRIDLNLSPTFDLPGGTRFWIEVEPSNVFTVNGQTGWCGAVGIGNGQESYIRFPLLGLNTWTTATAEFGSAIELGMIIEGNPAGGPVHDMRTSQIVAPGARIPPLTAVAPVAIYRNIGGFTEDFTANFKIDSLGTVVYTASVPVTGLPPSTSDTVTFPNWTPGAGDGFIYNLTAFTVDAQDLNPSNDTLHGTTLISLLSNWIRCADMPSAELCNGTGYDPVNDKIYSFCGSPDGGYTYTNYVYQYDPGANTWATMAPAPHAGDWVDASYVRGKFYVFGCFDGTARNYNMIYDVAGNSWSSGTNMPIARLAGGQVAYNDSLVYMLGGSDGTNSTNNVQIYNTYTNAWTTGTALPDLFRMGGVAIVHDTIYIIGGYNNSAYNSTLWTGIINPSACETITWSTGGTALPAPNLCNGATQMHRQIDATTYKWCLYLVGGFANGVASSAAWEYDVAAATWTALPNYPNVIVRNDFLIAREGHNEIQVCGGARGNWTGEVASWKLHWSMMPGVQEKPGTTPKTAFGFAPAMNPIKGRITLAYTIPSVGSVNLKVYDGTGRLVKVLAQGVQPAGTKTVVWDAKDNAGLNLMSGVYFVRLEADGQAATYKLVLVK